MTMPMDATQQNELVDWLESRESKLPPEAFKAEIARRWPSCTVGHLEQAVEQARENRNVRYVQENLWTELVAMAIERTPGATKDTLIFDVLRKVGWLDEANRKIIAPPEIVAEAERRLIAKIAA